MQQTLQTALGYWWILPIILTLALYKQILRLLFGMVMIADNELGIVNKIFVLVGKNKTLPDGKIIALNGEAGIQADTLAPGVKFGYWPWQYEIKRVPLTVIKKGTLGVVQARDGIPLASGRVLGKRVDSDSFQDARQFLVNGGERGTQIAIIPPGSYRINTSLFTISEAQVLQIPDNMVGIVTTLEGTPLDTGDIAGPKVDGHNDFQDGQTFVTKGGRKGLQEEVIKAGKYFINPEFATVEIKPMTEVPIAHVGVVISFVGAAGEDQTGEGYAHGNLVLPGQKGVCIEPLDPGKYAINPYTHKVESVQTSNIVLNWAENKTEAHKLDEELSTITVRSSDGFTFNLDVSQIIHIPRTDAPKVIMRFGSLMNMVTQVLEPTIGNYFRRAAQSSDVIAFLTNRSERQDEAKTAITAVMNEYNVKAVDTLIGDIVPPEALMKTLTDRKIAEQEKKTFQTQGEAQTERQKLEQSKAMADTQATVVASERKAAIAEFEANAAVKTAEGQAKAKVASAKGDAEAKTLNAEADAKVLAMVGDAEGKKITAVGDAEAKVIRQKTEAQGQGNYAVVEIARLLAAAGIKLTPDVVVNGGGGGGSGSGVMGEMLLANLLREQMAKKDATK